MPINIYSALQKIVFSVDAQLLKIEICFFSITEPCNLKARFLIKSGYYIVPSPSTALLTAKDPSKSCFGSLARSLTLD